MAFFVFALLGIAAICIYLGLLVAKAAKTWNSDDDDTP
jgi:hypothetical protein